MQLDEELSRFVTGSIMIVLGAADEQRRPVVARGLGVLGAPGDRAVQVLLSAWQWPRFVEVAERSQRMAMTCTRPSDYVSYQLKGGCVVRPAGAAEQQHAARYARDMRGVLADLGVPDAMIDHWLIPRDLVVADLSLAEVYLQTPGPRAGTAL